MLKLTTREGNLVVKFDGQADFDNFLDYSLASRIDLSETHFIGRRFQSMQTVKSALTEAWEDGIAVMERFLTRLKSIEFPKIKEVKARKVFATDGDDVDFERMMSGNPEFYVSVVREKSDQPTTITIVIDVSTPWTVDAEDILWRGASAIALASLLEERGYQCEIWMVKGTYMFSDAPGVKVVPAILLKRPSDPLDVSTLISVVSGWFYRTETFLFALTMGQLEGKRVKGSFGTPEPPSEDELDLITTDQKRIYSSQVFTFDGACSLIESELLKIANEE